MTAPAAISDTLRLLHARQLAEQGRLREAEAALAGAESASADPALLHTLAVIVTRQGDYSRARRLWRQLEQARPGDVEAERMITAIETWQTRPAWIGYVPVAAACALGLLLAVFFWPYAPAKPKSYTQPAATVEPLAIVPVATAGPASAPLPASPPAHQSAREPEPEVLPMVIFELPPAKPRH